MDLHIVDDEKFINGSIDIFEQYNPENNLFVVNISSVPMEGKLKYVAIRKELVILNLSNKDDQTQLFKTVESRSVRKVFIHYLSPVKATIANVLKKKYNVKTFWIFYGADLYGLLHQKFGYQLYDQKPIKTKSLHGSFKEAIRSLAFFVRHRETSQNAIFKFIENLDFFCFWNDYDYLLLRKFFKTNAYHLYFIYFNALIIESRILRPKTGLKIIINNSASLNGNHGTILNKIHQLDKFNEVEKLIVPLSYGNSTVVKDTIKLGERLFQNRFIPVLEYMDKETYFQIFDDASIAFFGARRQEAAANIFQLLNLGIKIFLRSDNNMINYLKDKGFVVFNFEMDFKSIEDLRPLSSEEIIHNKKTFHSLFNNEAERQTMEKIINI